MKKILLAGLVLLSSVTTLCAQTGEKNFIDRPYLEVTGRAEMEVVPDRIYMNISINEKDSKGKVVLAQLEKDLLAKLKELGIDTKKDLSISDMSSNFKKYLMKGTDIVTSKEYELVVGSAQMAGNVLMALEKIGISNVSIERVDHSQMEQFRREVKVKAIKAAKEKASDMASAIGQTAGKALYIQEVDFGMSPMMGRLAGMDSNVRFKAEASDSSADVAFEKIHLEYQVNARFELN